MPNLQILYSRSPATTTMVACEAKQVFWYLANTDELNVKLSHEHTNYMWVNFDEASEQLTFEQEINGISKVSFLGYKISNS